MIVMVVSVSQGARERLMEIDVAGQVIVATSSKEGIISAVTTAFKVSEDVNCYEFESYGFVRDDRALSTSWGQSNRRQQRIAEMILHTPATNKSLRPIRQNQKAKVIQSQKMEMTFVGAQYPDRRGRCI
jgi:hypothetical protein